MRTCFKDTKRKDGFPIVHNAYEASRWFFSRWEKVWCQKGRGAKVEMLLTTSEKEAEDFFA